MPSIPTLRTSDIQPTSVVLTWTQSSQEVVEHYEIKYWRTNFCSAAPSGNRTVDGHLRNFILNGLEENIAYRITIRAVNSLYHSDYSTADITTQITSEFCISEKQTIGQRSTFFVCTYPENDFIKKQSSLKVEFIPKHVHK